ncbi:MAG: ferredoxin [Thermofilaceae archaeon]|nr:ferredoxin [Thermofilaceae archaeon]MCX8181348.1 ferredoxin [Thermofilaceae archaeon]MDW8003591.1 ferredoxin [Thermofilaceae archaeon]
MPVVKVDKGLCIGCGACWALAPQVFEEDPSTYKSKIKEPYRRTDNENESIGEVPEELIADAKTAAEGCPTGAIIIE